MLVKDCNKRKKRKGGKMDQKWIGPFEITKRKGTVAIM